MKQDTKKATVNYIKLINFWWEQAANSDNYKSSYTVLFFAIVDSINRNNWKSTNIPLDYILNKARICKKMYLEAREWLSLNQFIDFQPGKNANQMATFSIGLAVQKCTGMVTTTDGLQVHNETGTDTHYINNKPFTDKTLNILFDQFWQLYDKKVGKEKAETLWHKLTDNERQDAIDYIPEYKQATPDKQYRKDPATFLKNKAFYDEIVKRSEISQSKNNGAKSLLKSIKDQILIPKLDDNYGNL